MDTPLECCCEEEDLEKRPWFKKPLYLTLLGTAVLLALSYVFPVLRHFRHELHHYTKAFLLSIGLGLLLGGVIDYYMPREYISKVLAKKSKKTIFYAIGLGFLMSICCHGILAISVELHKKGASGPAVVSFLLASPWASLPMTIVLVGFFGWKAFGIILGALLVAVVTGLIFQFLEAEGWIEENKKAVLVPAGFSIRKDIARRFREYSWTVSEAVRDAKGIFHGTVTLLHTVFWWILLGMVLASFVAAFVPQSIFRNYFGPTLLGLFATLALATVLEVCSTGTAPLAFEIYRQTGAFGNVFLFLMGGVVTNYTAIALIGYNLGKKTALWMVLVTIPQVLLWGWIFNLIF